MNRPTSLIGAPILGALALLGSIVAFQGQAPAQTGVAAPAERSILIEDFIREGSRQSEQARDFLADLERRRRGLRVVARDVAWSPPNLARLHMLSGHFGVGEPRIPTIYAAGRLIVGICDAATTGRQIEDLLRMQVFTREGCPRCVMAMPYVHGLNSSHQTGKCPGA